MATLFLDRAQETTSVVGTGSLTLLGAKPAFQRFRTAGLSDGNATPYVIVGQTTTEWEVQLGAISAVGTVLARNTPLASSNGGALVNFSAGIKDVFSDIPASFAQFLVGGPFAPLASPGLTGTPTAPTAAPGTNTTQLATTAFVTAAVAAGPFLLLAGGTMTGITTYNLGSTVNAAVTQSVLDITAADPNATQFLTGYAVATGVNGTDPTFNDVWSMGWNLRPGNGVSVAAKPAVGIVMERWFSPTGLGSDQSELHLTSWDSAGTEHRLFSFSAPHNGGGAGSTASFSVDTIAFFSNAGAVPFQLRTSANSWDVQLSSIFNVTVNGYAFTKQLNAAGNAGLKLPYIDANDQLNMGGDAKGFLMNGATPTAGPFANVFAAMSPASGVAGGILLLMQPPSVTGAYSSFEIRGNCTGTNSGLLTNNTGGNTGAHATYELRVQTTGGNPQAHFYANGGSSWWFGMDQQNSNRFAFGTGNSPIGSADKIFWDTSGNFTAVGSVKSNNATGGVGYATGAGGTVTQATSKATGVTLNKASGAITMNNAALLPLAFVSFVVTNSALASTDGVVVWIASGGTANAYAAYVTAVASGSFTITVENITAGSLSEAPVIGFAVIKAVTS